MNAPSVCFTRDELFQLTGKRYFGAQVKALNTMGINHRIRPDGSPMVMRGDVHDDSKPIKAAGPDFSQLDVAS